jgi:hypothetical protein
MMTDGMALAKPTPTDIIEAADEIVQMTWESELDRYQLRHMVVLGMQRERQRCANIIDAEAEWGGDIREAERKVLKGEGPRRIPGYNWPSD